MVDLVRIDIANRRPDAIASVAGICALIRAVISAFAESSAYVSNNFGDAERCRPSGDGGWAARYDDLKRYRSIPSFLIFDSRVCLGRPSFAAAPVAPPMTPCASRSAASMIAFSL